MSKTAVLFAGTKEQEEQLIKLIDENKSMEGCLIPILHGAQEIYGYLPIEVQKIIAQELDTPLAEVYGVVTFYSQFHLYPKGQYKIAVCMGTACYVKGAGQIIDKIKDALSIEVAGCTPDMKFSLDATRCIGACGLAPVMTVNEDVYGQVELSEVKSILEKYSN